MYFKKALKSLMVFSAIIAALLLALFFLMPQWLYTWWWALWLYFVLTGIGSARLVELASRQKEPEARVPIFLGITVVRLLISLGLIVVVLLTDKANKTVFVANFMVLYLAYLIFEITHLIANLRSHFEKP